MTGPTCPTCDHVHVAGDVVALSRFAGTSGYRAGGDAYPTRAAAEAALCAERAGRRGDTAEAPAPPPTPVPRVVGAPKPPPPPFPAVEMENAARAKAWRDLLAQVRLSLMVWEIDGEVRAGCEHVLAWLRRCQSDLAGLGARPAERRTVEADMPFDLFSGGVA